jgi:hypothetical protein
MNPLIDQWLNDYRLAFITVGSLQEEESASLLQSLKSIPPLLDSEQLASTVINVNPYLQKEVVEDLLELLFSIYNLSERSDVPIDEIITQIVQSISESEELSLEISTDKVEKIRARLGDILDENGTIANSYKAIIILKDHKCVFNDCRIFTDIRPIFGVDTTVNPVGMGLVHMLKLVYVGLDGPNELFIGLDSSNLEQLSEEIQRAMSKETSIKKMFDDLSIHCL